MRQGVSRIQRVNDAARVSKTVRAIYRYSVVHESSPGLKTLFHALFRYIDNMLILRQLLIARTVDRRNRRTSLRA